MKTVVKILIIILLLGLTVLMIKSLIITHESAIFHNLNDEHLKGFDFLIYYINNHVTRPITFLLITLLDILVLIYLLIKLKSYFVNKRNTNL